MITDEERWDLIHQKTHTENTLHSKFAEDVEKNFPRSSIVLDIGGGTGSDALYFLRKGHKVVLLDISAFALKLAQSRAKEENFGDKLVLKKIDFGFEDMPIKPNSVDIVYSRISLNYFGAKHTTKIFRDILTLLKNGGKAFLSFKSPDDESEMEYLRNIASVYEENVFIENGQLRSRFTKEQIEVMLKNAGIQSYVVNPYKEDLTGYRKDHKNILFTNVISFTKTE